MDVVLLSDWKTRLHQPWRAWVGSILLLVITSSSPALALLGVLPLHAAWAAAPVRRTEGEVDVLLGVQADNEGRDVHHLLADPGGGRQVSRTGKQDAALLCVCFAADRAGATELH